MALSLSESLNQKMEAVVEEMADYLVEHLEGTADSQKRVVMTERPSREFIVNSLSHRGVGQDLERVNATSISANALSISFLVEKNLEIDVDVKTNFSVYYAAYPTYEEQINENDDNLDDDNEDGLQSIDLKKVWKRFDFNSEISKIKIDVDADEEKNVNIDDMIQT